MMNGESGDTFYRYNTTVNDRDLEVLREQNKRAIVKVALTGLKFGNFLFKTELLHLNSDKE